MECSLGGKLEEELRARVLATDSDFESAKSFITERDEVLCSAPLIIGKLLATKEEIRRENTLR